MLLRFFDTILRCRKITLTQITDRFIKRLYFRTRHVLSLLLHLIAKLVGFVASLLQLVRQFLSIACGVAGFFVDTFCQLLLLLRAQFLIPAQGCNKVQGRPFLVSELEEAIEGMLKS